MFGLLLSLNIKQYKKIGESGLMSYGNDWNALCSSLQRSKKHVLVPSYLEVSVAEKCLQWYLWYASLPSPPKKKNNNNNWAGTTLIIKVDDYIWPTRIVMPSGLRLKMFVFFNVNEQLTAIFEIGQRYVLYELSLFLLFTLDYLSEHSHIYTGLILLITQNLPRYFLFTFRLFVWLIQPKYMSHPSH